LTVLRYTGPLPTKPPIPGVRWKPPGRFQSCSRTILLCPIYSRLVAHSTPECLCYTRRVPYVFRS